MVKEAICPKCGSGNVLKINYGLPTDEGREGAKRGEYVLGGCIVTEENRCCKDCGTWFIHDGGTFAEDGW